MNYVVDSSAVLALLWGEPGSERVAEEIPAANMSSVNHAEIVGKLIDRGATETEAEKALSALGFSVVPFDKAASFQAGYLRKYTRQFGLSLGDRACLAVAMILDAPVLTADRAWAELDLGLKIEVTR